MANKRGSAKKSKKALAFVLVIITMFLTGCGNNEDKTSASVPTNAPATEQSITIATPNPTTEPTVLETLPESTLMPDDNTKTAITEKNTGLEISDIQKNSITMLNYLAATTEEINASRNSRLFLEEAYSTLLNNTHPNAVDVKTQSQLEFLLDTLNNYRMIAVKRDRLQFIYEQNKAQAIRDSVPNPLGLLSAVSTFDLKKAAASVIYMAVDSYASYKTSNAQADMQFIQDGWELDDEQQNVLNDINIETFGYLNSTVRELGLKGDDALLALTPDDVNEFVKWKASTNISQTIRYLESSQNKYKAFGEYWLVLAESYYDHGDYDKCLEAISAYESLEVKIFREDHGYAKVLPLGIISASETYSEEDYIQTAERYADAIIKNTFNNKEWSLRYFAAQTYIDLYSRTKQDNYLSKAYEIALDNVNWLVDTQKKLNSVFLADVVEQSVPKDATEAEKKEIENYNKQLKEDRKAELPPVYEPFLLNCELLFALADEMVISDTAKTNIQEILHEKDVPLFLVPELNARYSFSPKKTVTDYSSSKVEFSGKELIIPAEIVTDNASIKVSIISKESGESIIFDDWKLIKVERSDKNNLDTFTAYFTSSDAEKYSYGLDSTIRIDIQAKKGIDTETVSFVFVTYNTKTNIFAQAAFWNSNIGYKRIK